MPVDKETSLRKVKPTLLPFEILLLSFLVIATFMIEPYLLPIMLGLILAVLTHPLYDWFRKMKLGPKRSAGLVVVLVMIIVVGPLTLLSTVAVKQGIVLGQKVLSDENYSLPAIAKRLETWGPIKNVIDDPATFETQIRSGVENLGRRLSQSILIQAGAIPDFLLQLALSLVTCFFLLLDGKRFHDWISDKIPIEMDVQLALRNSFQTTSVSVIRATVAAAAAQVVVITIGFLALGVPGTALAAGATFILAWIPVLGCSPVWAVAAIYLFLSGSLTKAIIMILIGLSAGIVDNIVRPVILKGKTDMHPLVSLIAIFGGIHLFGLMGVFVGPIIAAVLILLLKTWPAVAERAGFDFHHKKRGHD